MSKHHEAGMQCAHRRLDGEVCKNAAYAAMDVKIPGDDEWLGAAIWYCASHQTHMRKLGYELKRKKTWTHPIRVEEKRRRLLRVLEPTRRARQAMPSSCAQPVLGNSRQGVLERLRL